MRRLLAMWLNQDYEDRELIIFNTDVEHPIILDSSLIHENITVINNNIDYETKQQYNDTGSIRRDALTHASGDYFMLWDDDDLYLHFNLTQAVDQIERTGKKAWKPEKSFFKNGETLSLEGNYMEASVIAEMSSIRQYGFKKETASESLSWYHGLKMEGQLNENNKNYIPAYCFNWSDPYDIGGHKQSSTIDDPNNFELHKERCVDMVTNKLTPMDCDDLCDSIIPLYEFIHQNKSQFPIDLYEKYL